MNAQRPVINISPGMNALYLAFSAVIAIGVSANYWQSLSRFIDACRGRLRLKRLTAAAKNNEDEDSDSNASITLSQIFIYPVKSLRAVSLKEAVVDDKGLVGDRRFMLIVPRPPPLLGSFGPGEATHQFVSQRQCPSLATVVADLNSNDHSLNLSSHLVPSQNMTINPKDAMEVGKTYKARLWGDTVEVVDMGDKAASFFIKDVVENDKDAEEMWKQDIRLVAMKRDDRLADEKYTPSAALSWTGGLPKVALADGFPILIANQASLDDLNERLKRKGKEPIPMSRFRPNIVVSGIKPFEEDTWKVIDIGGVLFHLVKGCPRCKESCTDQENGSVSDEPVATLSEFRALGPVKENVYFAQNAIAHETGGTIRVGTSIRVLERGPPVWDT